MRVLVRVFIQIAVQAQVDVNVFAVPALDLILLFSRVHLRGVCLARHLRHQVARSVLCCPAVARKDLKCLLTGLIALFTLGFLLVGVLGPFDVILGLLVGKHFAFKVIFVAHLVRNQVSFDVLLLGQRGRVRRLPGQLGKVCNFLLQLSDFKLEGLLLKLEFTESGLQFLLLAVYFLLHAFQVYLQTSHCLLQVGCSCQVLIQLTLLLLEQLLALGFTGPEFFLLLFAFLQLFSLHLELHFKLLNYQFQLHDRRSV